MSRLKRVGQRRNDALARTHWAQVETLLADYYLRAGYTVDHCGTGFTGAKFDGGVDLKLRRDNEYIVVQCKHWNAMKVAHNDVHQLIGLMVNEGATGAILVTSGEFTRAAIEASAKQGHVKLVDGNELRAMLGPLPEPNGPPKPRFEELMSSDLGQNAKGVAKYAGERLLNAAEDRIRGGGRASVASRTASVTAKVLFLKAVVGLIVPVLIVLALMIWVKQASRPGNLAPTASAASDPVQPQRQVVQPHQAQAEAVVIEPVEAAAPVYTPHEPTPEEIREQQRKAEEAIKILEATTPELYQGRPGQVRGQ